MPQTHLCGIIFRAQPAVTHSISSLRRAPTGATPYCLDRQQPAQTRRIPCYLQFAMRSPTVEARQRPYLERRERPGHLDPCSRRRRLRLHGRRYRRLSSCPGATTSAPSSRTQSIHGERRQAESRPNIPSHKPTRDVMRQRNFRECYLIRRPKVR